MMTDEQKTALAEAYASSDQAPAWADCIITFEGTADEWFLQHERTSLSALNHLPAGFFSQKVVDDSLLLAPHNGVQHIVFVSTQALEQYVAECDRILSKMKSPVIGFTAGRRYEYVKDQLELRHKEEQEFLVKTIQTI